MVFYKLCVRTAYEKKSVVDSTSHVKDEKIMKPLLKAKENWVEKPIEKINIKVSLKVRGNFSFTRNVLCADLLLHSQFTKNKKIVILVHGFTDSASGMAYLAEAYFGKKISVLAVNLRGHGESEGDLSGLGYLHTDALDIAKWVNYIMERFGDDTNIVLHGVSMGGASVIQAAYGYSLPVKLVVSDCSFSDYSTNVKKLVQGFFPKNTISVLLIRGIYTCASLVNYVKNGFFFGKNSPKKALLKTKEKNILFPLLIFHGENDSLVHKSSAKELYSAAPLPKKIVIIKEAPHIGSYFYDKKTYMESILFYLQD